MYPLPVDHDGSLATLLNRSRLFVTDLPDIHRRRDRHTYGRFDGFITRPKKRRYGSGSR
jgi:hypothetical protein